MVVMVVMMIITPIDHLLYSWRASLVSDHFIVINTIVGHYGYYYFFVGGNRLRRVK